MAAPTSLSPNFCELQFSHPIALYPYRRKALEVNQVSAALDLVVDRPAEPIRNSKCHGRPAVTLYFHIIS
jgi:hypothetical protein